MSDNHDLDVRICADGAEWVLSYVPDPSLDDQDLAQAIDAAVRSLKLPDTIWRAYVDACGRGAAPLAPISVDGRARVKLREITEQGQYAQALAEAERAAESKAKHEAKAERERTLRARHACQHRPTTSTTRGYMGSSPGTEGDRRAAGGVTIEDTCRCGAVRYTDRNGGHSDVGRWLIAHECQRGE
jgi:hypothetical protein